VEVSGFSARTTVKATEVGEYGSQVTRNNPVTLTRVRPQISRRRELDPYHPEGVGEVS
jgi:hypothetical protein